MNAGGQQPVPAAQPRRTANGFLFQPISDIDGRPATDYRAAWDWHYAIVEPFDDPNDLVHAEEIARTAAMLREFYSGRTDAAAPAGSPERDAAIAVMTRLKNLFIAVVVQGQKAEPEWVRESVAAARAEFIRRVIEPRHRRNLLAPVTRALGWMLFTMLLAFVSLASVTGLNSLAGGAVASVLPRSLNLGVLPGTLLMVISGTLMGRLLFFAISFGERLRSIEDFIAIQRYTGESANLSLLFDAVTGFAAFLLFQSSFLVITIGAGSEAATQNPDGTVTASNTAISTENIDENWLIAFGFGILVGLSRAAFLGRIRDLSKSQFTDKGR